MLYRLARWSAVLAVVCSICSTTGVWAQNDTRIDTLLEKLQALTEDEEPVFLRQHIQVAVNGQTQEDRIQETWVQDWQHLRMDASDGTVLVYTPELVMLYHGPSKVLVTAPKETLDALGDRREAELAVLGINTPKEPFKLLREGKEHLSISGEDTIADEACWVLTCDKELAPKWKAILSGIPEGFEITVADIAVGKETAMPRQLYFELTGPVRLTVSVTIEEVEKDPEITDDLFTFKAPDDALTLTWTPDKSGAEMRKLLEQSIVERQGQ